MTPEGISYMWGREIAEGPQHGWIVPTVAEKDLAAMEAMQPGRLVSLDEIEFAHTPFVEMM